MFRTALSYLFASLCLTACTPAQSPTKAPAQTSLVAAKAQAKLVLVVVLDQMPSTALLRYAPHLAKDGILRQAIEQGMFHERVRYGYAGTNTAPGHASIYTGEVPADHGIDANDIYNYDASTRMQIINDGKHQMFGVPDLYASPWKLLKPTVGDKLHQKHPDAKVISVSLKARAAVVSGGQSADLVTWYSPKLPGFTTSQYYEEQMPSWMEAWNSANPVAQRYAIWNPGDAALYQKVNGADDAAGEADWHGLGTSFPHDVAKTVKPTKVFTATPQSVPYLLDMARTLVSEYKLGADDVPDLLSVSISTTDYAGHTFGADSWEYFDVLLKADKALTEFVNELQASTHLAVVVTSDHGGTPLAENSIAKGLPGGRLFSDVLVDELEVLADKTLGEGNWLQSYIQPYLYLHADAKDGAHRDKLLALIADYGKSSPKIEAIYPADKARSLRESAHWLDRDVAHTVAQRTEALFVVPAKWHVASPAKGTGGTGHGTPWDSDREVPLMAIGAGIDTLHNKEIVAQNRVAATIAQLLGLEWHLPVKSLTEKD